MSQTGKSRFREKAIAALLSASSIEQAAKECGVTKRTLLRWLKDASFRAEYQEAKTRILRSATSKLTLNSLRAVEVLKEIFEGDPEAHQGARATSAIATIRLSLDAFELESLEERIRALEAHQNEI